MVLRLLVSLASAMGGALRRAGRGLQRRIAVAVLRRLVAADLSGTVGGLPFRMPPGVFPSHLSLSTEMIIAALAERPGLAQGGAILEIGTGCGAIVAHLAAGARRAVATDVSAAALEAARANLARLGLLDRVELLQSDLFAAVDGRFDLLVWNPPYFPGRPRDPEEVSILEDGLLGRFLAGARERLEPSGSVVLALSSLGDAGAIAAACRGWRCETLARRRILLEEITVQRLTPAPAQAVPRRGPAQAG